MVAGSICCKITLCIDCWQGSASQQYYFVSLHLLSGTLSKDWTGTWKATAQKNHISGLVFVQVIGGFIFFALNSVNRKQIKRFCYGVLVVSTILKKVFSSSSFSDNSVQELSSMHSNVQLLYLLILNTYWLGPRETSVLLWRETSRFEGNKTDVSRGSSQ